MGLGNTSGFTGVVRLVLGTIVICEVISHATGQYAHWLLAPICIVVGVWTVMATHKVR